MQGTDTRLKTLTDEFCMMSFSGNHIMRRRIDLFTKTNCIMKTLSNRVQLIGNLGQDPELKTFESGNSLCKFSLATNSFYRDKNGERVQETEWHNIIAWGKLGELMSEMLEKGTKVAIIGKLTYRQYESNDGTKRTSTEIIVDEFLIMERNKAREEVEAA